MFSTALVRDHDEIDAMLATIVDAATPIEELPDRLEAVRRVLAMHAVVEALILDRLPASARSFAIQMQLDHADAADAIAALARVPAGTGAWYVQALDLRELVRDHAGAMLRLISQLGHMVAESELHALARDYSDERERVLGDSSLATALRTARTGS